MCLHQLECLFRNNFGHHFARFDFSHGGGRLEIWGLFLFDIVVGFAIRYATVTALEVRSFVLEFQAAIIPRTGAAVFLTLSALGASLVAL